MTYQIPDSIFIQEIDDEVIILDSNTQEYFTINQVGKDIWELLSKELTLEEVVTELMEIYDISKEQLESDVKNFIEALSQKGLIKIID